MTMLVILLAGACTWTWDCTGTACRQVSLCDGPAAVVPPRPPGIPPMRPPVSAPAPLHTIPPLGTSSCEQRLICARTGDCRWQTVCQ